MTTAIYVPDMALRGWTSCLLFLISREIVTNGRYPMSIHRHLLLARVEFVKKHIIIANFPILQLLWCDVRHMLLVIELGLLDWDSNRHLLKVQRLIQGRSQLWLLADTSLSTESRLAFKAIPFASQ